MQFISTEDMKKFTELGYEFSSKYTTANIGSTYHVIVTDKDGNEVVHTKSSYGNASGHGYAMSFAQNDAVAQLKAIIEGKGDEKEEYDTDFLNTLANWCYIYDYGYTEDGELVILFDSWDEVEGREEYNKETEKWERKSKSVYAKLVDLAEKNLLKPSINRTIKEVGYAFTDSMRKCDHCGTIVDAEWGGLEYIEELGEEVCHKCIDEDSDILEVLIDRAKDEFKKALPADISDEKVKELGYEELDEDKCFSTRSEQWGEDDWGCYNIHHSVIEELCHKYNGFPKLTWVGQFDANYTALFPSDTIEQARAEFKTIVG